MPDGSFCRAALLAGEPLTSVEYDWIGYTLQRQPCDDVRQAIYEWVTREFERLGLHRDKDNANKERLLGCLRRIRTACLLPAQAIFRAPLPPPPPSPAAVASTSRAAPTVPPTPSDGAMPPVCSPTPGLSTPKRAPSSAIGDDLLSGQTTVQRHRRRCLSPVGSDDRRPARFGSVRCRSGSGLG